MKILITGHAGFIGGYLVKKLDNYIGLDIKEGNDILTCHLPEADIIIHLAALPGVIASMKDPFSNAHTNILGTIRLAKRYKDKRFIFASSGGTIQEKIESAYGLSKFCAEEYIKLLCNDYVILRFANVYGKGSRSVVDKFLNNNVVIYGDGSATRTYVYINDMVNGIIQSMKWPKGSYYFGSSQNYTVLQIAEAIGKPIKFKGWREGELKKSSLKNTTPDWQPTMDVLDYIKQKI